MKETIKSIIDTRSVNSIHFGLIVFGAAASTAFDIGNKFTSSKLKELIDSARRQAGNPAFDKAFEETRRQFESSVARPQAEKVLVVIVDNKSDMGLGEMSSAVKQLEDIGIEAIPVAIGNEPDLIKLRIMGSKKQTLVQAAKDENPRVLGKRIMEKMLAGTMW